MVIVHMQNVGRSMPYVIPCGYRKWKRLDSFRRSTIKLNVVWATEVYNILPLDTQNYSLEYFKAPIYVHMTWPLFLKQ